MRQLQVEWAPAVLRGGRSVPLPLESGGRGCGTQVTRKSKLVSARPAARLAICTGAVPVLPFAS